MNDTAITTPEEFFDLDVTFLDNGPVIAGLLSATDDNCGSTSASACVTCMTS